jgi:hypothetical protein
VSTASSNPHAGGEKPDETKEARVDQLLREGIAAAKIGDKETARSRLQEVVSLDQYNEKGWYWLASVVESNEERKVCLGNVVVINPGNARAQQMLDRLSRRTASTSAGYISGDFVPEDSSGKPDRRRLLILGSIVGIVIVLILALTMLRGGNEPTPTIAVLPTEVSPTVAVSTANPANAAGAGTATTEESVAFATVVMQTPPPTFTPLPSPTHSGLLTGTPLASPPPGLPGRLIVVSGGYLSAKDINLPLFMIDLADTPKMTPLVPSDRGEYGVLTPDGQRLVYGYLATGTDTEVLRLINLNGTQPTDLSSLWNNQPPLANLSMVSIARNGRALVFVATSIIENDFSPDVYYLPANLVSAGPEPAGASLTAAPSGPTKPPPGPTKSSTAGAPAATSTRSPFVKVNRVTAKDSGYNSWPSISPNGKTVVFAANGSTADLGGTHIYSVPVEGGAPKNLTSNMGANAETEPEWAPDGTKIVFRVAPKASPYSDIYVMNADGGGKKQLVSGVADNIRPHWSPDGKYVAFTSNRTGKWEVFVVEVASGAIFQVTQTEKTTLCTSWSQ